MKKVLKLAFLFSFIGLLFYSFISIGFRIYVSNNTKIEFLNKKYTRFDYLATNFVPFGSDNSWYNFNDGYYTLLGLSFLKTDTDKNFIYYNNILDTTVYIRDSYVLPEFPTPNVVDELILNYEAEDKDIYIKDKKQIEDIIEYLSTFSALENKQDETTIVFYAVSNSLGGVFRLNESGTMVVGDMPDKIQEIIQSYQSGEGSVITKGKS